MPIELLKKPRKILHLNQVAKCHLKNPEPYAYLHKINGKFIQITEDGEMYSAEGNRVLEHITLPKFSGGLRLAELKNVTNGDKSDGYSTAALNRVKGVEKIPFRVYLFDVAVAGVSWKERYDALRESVTKDNRVIRLKIIQEAPIAKAEEIGKKIIKNGWEGICGFKLSGEYPLESALAGILVRNHEAIKVKEEVAAYGYISGYTPGNLGLVGTVGSVTVQLDSGGKVNIPGIPKKWRDRLLDIFETPTRLEVLKKTQVRVEGNSETVNKSIQNPKIGDWDWLKEI